MFRRVLVATPAATLLLAAVPTQKARPIPIDTYDERSHYKCRPSELPLYQPLHALDKMKNEHPPSNNSNMSDTLESGVRVVRIEVQAGLSALGEQKKQVETYLDTAKAHTQSTIDYLNEPHNVLPRSGAIAIGGLAGFIFAARGGFIKKVLYTTAGAGAIASLCYPRQAEQFARDALYESRKVFAIAYNFAKGVKPGDEMPVEPINKFPTSVQDIKFLLADLYEEAKEAVLGKKK